MPFKTALPWISRVALAAFVWFFSTVCSQTLPQIVCISWNIITHITWLRVETVSLQNVALWYSMWSLKTSSQIYQIQLKLFSLVWRGALKLLTKSQLLHALVWNGIQHFLFYVDQDKHVCDSSKLILFPHISQEFLLLLRLGFAPWAVSPDIDLCGVFKRCQKKRIIKDYHLKLYLKNRGGNQATPIAIAFRSLLLWYFRRSMLPLQLWIHFFKSLEISHEEDRDKRESDLFIFCFVRVWRCRTLTWVFI